jgi:hypothetical protein
VPRREQVVNRGGVHVAYAIPMIGSSFRPTDSGLFALWCPIHRSLCIILDLLFVVLKNVGSRSSGSKRVPAIAIASSIWRYACWRLAAGHPGLGSPPRRVSSSIYYLTVHLPSLAAASWVVCSVIF